MKNRRNFIKNVGAGLAGAMVAPMASEAMGISEKVVGFENGVELELLTRDSQFLGIGKVRCGEVSLRSGRLPMFVQINTPDGLELVDYQILQRIENEKGITLVLGAKSTFNDQMEWMLHTVRNRRNIRDWTEAPQQLVETKLSLTINSIKRDIGTHSFVGFSYQYAYDSEQLPIYKITDRGSWEIGGSSLGNQLWMRNGVVDSMPKFTNKDQFYSTEWYLPGIANPNIFQFHPLQTQLQGFTFTVSDKGILVTWPTEVAHIRSLFEKWRSHDEIVHFHEHCNDLSQSLVTSTMEVLWLPGQFDYIACANVYNDVREMVHETLHAQIGMDRERITTYGIVEEWTEPDFDNYTKKAIPALLDAGIKTIMIPNECQNTMNTWGVSNMCCNVDYKISEVVGEHKLKQFCQAAQHGGARIEMWGNTALSSLSELFSHPDGDQKGIAFLPYEGSIMEVIDKAKSPWVRNPSNAIEADHYNPRFCALNLRDEDIRKYWMKQWKYFHDEIGIEGIFLDSSFNMSSDKFHFRQWPENGNWHGATLDQKELLGQFRPETEPPKVIQTQYHAHLEWIVEMQKMGYHYCAEDMGVFGINRTGPALEDRIASLPMWADSFCDFQEDAIKKLGHEPLDVFFKGLAYRMMWKMHWDIKNEKLELGINDKAAFHLLKLYNQVEPAMHHRHVLDDERGVTYAKDQVSVLWAFMDFKFSLSKKSLVKDLITGKTQKVSEVKAVKNHVYEITNA